MIILKFNGITPTLKGNYLNNIDDWIDSVEFSLNKYFYKKPFKLLINGINYSESLNFSTNFISYLMKRSDIINTYCEKIVFSHNKPGIIENWQVYQTDFKHFITNYSRAYNWILRDHDTTVNTSSIYDNKLKGIIINLKGNVNQSYYQQWQQAVNNIVNKHFEDNQIPIFYLYSVFSG